MRARKGQVSTHARVPLQADWRFCRTDPGNGPVDAQWHEATLPCTVASALRALGRFSFDPTPGGEAPTPAIDASDWWFQTRFDRPAAHPAAHPAARRDSASDRAPGAAGTPAESDGANTWLVFDGLASHARVWLNGTEILASDNMFVAHEVSVGPLLRDKANDLVIVFASLDALLAQKRPRPRWRTPMVGHQQLRWHRTTLLGRTPGWSPPAPPVGPWRGIHLETRSGPALDDLRIATRIDERTDGHSDRTPTGIVEISVNLNEAEPARRVELVVERGGHQWRGRTTVGAPGPDGVRHTARVEIPAVERWWPHTHGEPACYRARLELAIAEADSNGQGEARGPSSTSAAAPIEIELGQIGFRTIALDTRDDGFGLSVNGVPVFCRGAVWTPLDAVSLQTDPEACARALDQVRDAGMNMLRVGGTIVYEDDVFLDDCDRLGILLWQDFMFANMDYPQGDAAFDASVRREARQLLARLQGRPAIAVLCGNSEVEQQAAMFGTDRERWSPPLFHDDAGRDVSRRCDPTCRTGRRAPTAARSRTRRSPAPVPTTASAPTGARSTTRAAPKCASPPSASAFANVPETGTLALLPGGLATRTQHPAWKARAPRDLGAGWDFDDVRDHYLARAVRRRSGRAAQRRSRSLPGARAGRERRCDGAAPSANGAAPRPPATAALVWLLRDLWPGAGWGLIDATGRPKAAWHLLRRALQPVSIALEQRGRATASTSTSPTTRRARSTRRSASRSTGPVISWSRTRATAAGSHRTRRSGFPQRSCCRPSTI